MLGYASWIVRQMRKRPIWVFLRDQQRWIEQHSFVEIRRDLVTSAYAPAQEDDCKSQQLGGELACDPLVAVEAPGCLLQPQHQATKLGHRRRLPGSDAVAP